MGATFSECSSCLQRQAVRSKRAAYSLEDWAAEGVALAGAGGPGILEELAAADAAVEGGLPPKFSRTQSQDGFLSRLSNFI